MTDPAGDALLQRLRRLDAKLDGLRDDNIEIKERLGSLEAQYASLSRRVDRIDTRLDRIERLMPPTC